MWTLPTNGGEALVLLAALAFGSALPALPVHFLWVNMTTAILLGLTLVFEPKERNLMQRSPRDPKAPILDHALIMRTGFVSLIILAGAFGLFLWEQRANAASLAEARTIVVNVIVIVEVFYLLNCRSLLHFPASVGLFSNPWIFLGIGCMIGAQILFTYAAFMNRFPYCANRL